jgi:hypothetical protein
LQGVSRSSIGVPRCFCSTGALIVVCALATTPPAWSAATNFSGQNTASTTPTLLDTAELLQSAAAAGGCFQRYLPAIAN